MTIDSIVSITNNIEEVLSKKDVVSKADDKFNGMDNKKNFEEIFEKNIEKNPTLKETPKLTNSKKDDENSINSVEFQNILKQATNDANIETSLDLTLAKDVSEIISQLKAAVESTTEIIEENSDEIADSSEEAVADILEVVEDLTVDIDSNETDDNAQYEDSKNSKEDANVQQQIVVPEKDFGVKIDNSKELNFKENSSEQEVSLFKNCEKVEVELSENIQNETIAKTSEDDNLVQKDVELNIDEEILKDLKIESFSAESNTSNGEGLMQNQTPEEHVVKTLIQQDAEAFELNVEQVQKTNNLQQSQAKTVEVNPSRIIDQISKHLETLQNNSKVNIVLNPESLGKVNIQLLTSKEGLTAQFTVATQEARDLLMKGLDGLKETLTSHGVGVDNVSVKIADSQKSEYRQDWTEQEGSRGGNKNQEQPNREEKEKGLFEKMMAETIEEENGKV